MSRKGRIVRPIVSLFDMTGNMVRPLAEYGYTTYCFDIQNTDSVEYYDNGGSITFLCADLLDLDWHNVIIELNPYIIFSFPPCTDLAVSGAAHFNKKLAYNPKYREEAMNLVYVAKDLGETIGCAYMIENPVSVIASEWRKPDYYFHPYEYGGYLPIDDIHPVYPQYIAPRDAYTKKTCLWTDKSFVMPSKIPIEPINRLSNTHTKLGGKSERTKNIRSMTPRGFAKAMALSIIERGE